MIWCSHIAGSLNIKPRDSQMDEKSPFSARNATGHAQAITAIHSPSTLMTQYCISAIILDGLESLETSKSIIRMKWKSTGLIGFHGSMEIRSHCIMERSPITCHLTNPLPMPLISKWARNPLGDPSTLSQKKSYQYSKNTSKKCSIWARFTQASHQQEHLFSSFQSLIAEAYDYV